MTTQGSEQIALLWLLLQAIILINGALLLFWAWRRRLGRAAFAPQWSIADLWFGGQFVLGLIICVSLAVLTLLLGFGVSINVADMSDRSTILYLLLPVTLLQNGIFFGVPAVFMGAKYRLRLREIGLPPLPGKREIAAGIVLGCAALIISHFLGEGIETMAKRFQDVPWVRAALEFEKTNPVAGILQKLPQFGIGGLLLSVLTIGVAAPLGEEMLFRGFAFNTLKRRLGLPAGLLLSALLFTLPHTYALGLVPVFLMGLLLAWTYQHSGSLWVPIIIHAVNNTASVLAAYYFPFLTK